MDVKTEYSAAQHECHMGIGEKSNVTRFGIEPQTNPLRPSTSDIGGQGQRTGAVLTRSRPSRVMCAARVIQSGEEEVEGMGHMQNAAGRQQATETKEDT